MLKVLIAEDDLMIADMTEEILQTNGYEVCGIARTVAEAVALGRDHLPDLAILDMRLADGGLGTQIAAEPSALTVIDPGPLREVDPLTSFLPARRASARRPINRMAAVRSL
jgi:CheY-like chemotaxis protein